MNLEHSIPRMHRTCLLCRGQLVEDELHVVMECKIYRLLRTHDKYKHLFDAGGGDMRQFFNQVDQGTLSEFLVNLLLMRKALLKLSNVAGLAGDASSSDSPLD